MHPRFPLRLCFLFLLPLVQALTLMPARANVGNFVWHDLDGDGRQDAGEPGIGGLTVQLWNAAKTQSFDTDVTNGSGSYSLTAPVTGDYRVRVILPFPGDAFSPRNQAAGDNTEDSDFNPSGLHAGYTDIIRITTGSFGNNTVDAGVILDPMRDHNIGDRVFRAEPDGTQPASGGAISGVTVELLSPGGAVLQTTTPSGSAGFYSFKAPPGTYRLRFTTVVNMVPSPHPDSGGNDNNDSDIDASGLTGTFTVAAGQVRRDLDAGFVNVVNLGNFVWDDLDKDGRQDPGEPGLPNIPVELWNPAKTQLVDATVTDANGNYVLHGLAGESYRIRAILPYAGDGFSPIDQAGGDDTDDSDVNPSGPDAGFTAAFNLGVLLLSTVGLDIGVVSDPMKDHNIGDQVFRADENGMQGISFGVSSVVVQLLSTTGEVLQTTTSAGNAGHYSFKAPPGTYRLRFVSPSNMMPSPRPDNGDDALDSDIFADGITAPFTVNAGTVRRDLDAGFVNRVQVGNFVWNDLDSDGLQDDGEPGLASVSVELWNAAKTERLDATVTDASGIYLLRAPGPGDYRLWVLRPLPEDSFTTPNAGQSEIEDSDILTNQSDFGFSESFFIAPLTLSMVGHDAGIRLAPGHRGSPLIKATLNRSGFAWSLTFTAPVGGTYLIERSSDLLNWTEVERPFITTPSKTTVALAAVPGEKKLWWRVRRVR